MHYWTKILRFWSRIRRKSRTCQNGFFGSGDKTTGNAFFARTIQYMCVNPTRMQLIGCINACQKHVRNAPNSFVPYIRRLTRKQGHKTCIFSLSHFSRDGHVGTTCSMRLWLGTQSGNNWGEGHPGVGVFVVAVVRVFCACFGLLWRTHSRIMPL